VKDLVASAPGLIKGHTSAGLLTDGHNVKAIDNKSIQNRHPYHENVESYDRTET
jgi:hypothetical protein